MKGTIYGPPPRVVRTWGNGFFDRTVRRGNRLRSFGSGFDGVNPYAGLINVKGTLYGTTRGGGPNKSGTVFSITPSGTETVVHSFGSGSDGVSPSRASST